MLRDGEGDPPEAADDSANSEDPSVPAASGERAVSGAGVGQGRRRGDAGASDGSWISRGVDAGDGGDEHGYGEEVDEEELDEVGGGPPSVGRELGGLRAQEGENDGMETIHVLPERGGVGYNSDEELDDLA